MSELDIGLIFYWVICTLVMVYSLSGKRVEEIVKKSSTAGLYCIIMILAAPITGPIAVFFYIYVILNIRKRYHRARNRLVAINTELLEMVAYVDKNIAEGTDYDADRIDEVFLALKEESDALMEIMDKLSGGKYV